MKSKHWIALALLGAAAVSPAAAISLYADDKAKAGDAKTEAKANAKGDKAKAEDDEEGFEKIFDGKALDNWDGDPRFWSVADEAITGQTTEQNPTDGNTFIVYSGGELSDFELRLEFRLVGGNSGIQYRSKLLDPNSKWRVGGYQADFEAGDGYNGILYDEGGVAGGRGIMSNRGEKTTYTASGEKKTEALSKNADELAKLIKKEDWNDYTIIAHGNHLVHKINGEVFTEVIDESPQALKSGILALQLHAGPPMKAQFRNIRLKKLEGTEKTDAAKDAGKKDGGAKK